jgi:type IV pilus modification protein PilV
MEKLRTPRVRRRKIRNGEQGLTLIEVMIAGLILVVGMLGFAALMATAIAANARSRTDSTASMLSQTVMEQIAASLIGKSGAAAPQVKDCTGTLYNIDMSPGGATLTTTDESIDWSQTTVPTGYQMLYQICASTTNTNSNAQETTYDVRWNVAKISNTNTYLIIAGARPKNYVSNLRYFALPVVLKMYVTPAAK